MLYASQLRYGGARGSVKGSRSGPGSRFFSVPCGDRRFVSEIEQLLLEELRPLVERGEERGCLELSEIDHVVTEADLDTDEIEELYRLLEARGIELRDDCGREDAP